MPKFELVEDKPAEEPPVPKGTSPVKRGRGRPPGSKNSTTIFKEAMQQNFEQALRKEFLSVLKATVQRAKDGDMRATKILFDRVIPVSKAIDLSETDRKGIAININVGNMEETQAIEIEGEYEKTS